MKKRLGSIDLFRGLCIIWMIVGHSIGWWTTSEFSSEVHLITLVVDAFGAAGFLFVSGMSITLSYLNKREKAQDTDGYNYRHLRLEYFLRALFILIVGFIYNTIMVIQYFNILISWQWFILQTIPISIMLMWPLLKYNKFVKLSVAIAFLIVDYFLFSLLSSFAYDFSNPYGILHYILYNGHQLSPILGFFPFFISGSIIGGILYEDYFSFEEQIDVNKQKVLLKFSLPIVLMGIGLILIGFFVVQPGIITKNQLSWLLYAAGAQLIFFSLLFTIEKLEIITIDKKYRFFYYFSYYSFSIFLLHYPIYFLFLNSLTLIQFFLIIPFVVIIIGLGLKLVYHTLGPWFSLKTQLSRLATETSFIIEELQNNKKKKENPVKAVKV